MSALEEIKARVEGHTEGPWAYHPSSGRVEDVPEFDLHRFDIMAIEVAKVQESHADGALIAAAPKLLAALEAVGKVHKPVEGCFSYTVCSTCFTEAEEIPAAYPCPTLKTIEEALS